MEAGGRAYEHKLRGTCLCRLSRTLKAESPVCEQLSVTTSQKAKPKDMTTTFPGPSARCPTALVGSGNHHPWSFSAALLCLLRQNLHISSFPVTFRLDSPQHSHLLTFLIILLPPSPPPNLAQEISTSGEVCLCPASRVGSSRSRAAVLLQKDSWEHPTWK